MLNDYQTQQYNRFNTLSQFLMDKANIPVYSAFAPFQNEVNDFQNNLATLNKLMPDKSVITSGISGDKLTQKHAIADALALACRKSRSYALKVGNDELAAATFTNNDKIFKMKDAQILPYATSIQALLTPFIGDPIYDTYGVTATILQGIVNDATTFKGIIGTAKVGRTVNTVADAAIDAGILKLQGNVAQFDLLIDEFADTNSGFVLGYHKNSETNTVGIRHSGIHGTAKDVKGNLLAGITVILEGTDKSAVTDLNGAYEIERVPPTDYKVTASGAGFTSQTLVHHISRGKIDEIDWVME